MWHLTPDRNTRGMTNCGKSCTVCPLIQYGKEVNVDHKTTWQIMKKMYRLTYNIVYLLKCQKESCKLRYIGSTGRLLKLRLGDHCGYILNQVTSRATGAHWNLLEECKMNSEKYRTKREKYFIRKFDTYDIGINREWWLLWTFNTLWPNELL